MAKSVAQLVRTSVRAQKPYRAGTTVEEARRKYGLERIVKLSSNENPLGPSPHAIAALSNVEDPHLYVNDDYAELRGAIARLHGVDPAWVIAGHGSNELSRLIFNTFVEPGDEVIAASPTFSLYPKDTAIAGATLVPVPLRDGVHDLGAMAQAVTPRTKLIVVCDPNNPTATQVDPADFDLFLARVGEDVLVLIDQAYREFQPRRSVEGIEIVRRRRNTLVLRTMSKVYGLAALRIGYGIGDPEAIEWMQRIRVPFNVSQPAVLAARAAIDDEAHFARVLAMTQEGRAYLSEEFARLGLFHYPSAANFFAVKVPVEADRAYVELMERGIIVRSGDGLGLPQFLRVTIGLPQENRAFIAALEALLATWSRETAIA